MSIWPFTVSRSFFNSMARFCREHALPLQLLTGYLNYCFYVFDFVKSNLQVSKCLSIKPVQHIGFFHQILGVLQGLVQVLQLGFVSLQKVLKFLCRVVVLVVLSAHVSLDVLQH